MSDVYISEPAALALLILDGDYAESNARIILSHSRQQTYDGRTFYPAAYISKRAREGARKSREQAAADGARFAIARGASPLYWHSTRGWIRTGFDRFTAQERETVRLPSGGLWAIAPDMKKGL